LIFDVFLAEIDASLKAK